VLLFSGGTLMYVAGANMLSAAEPGLHIALQLVVGGVTIETRASAVITSLMSA